MILIIDNYDSFSYNLYQLIGSINPNVKVIRNDQTTIEEIEEMNPEAIIISPGPGRPVDAGICVNVIKHFYTYVPILGVCLGHQAICEAFGAKISYAKELMHGKQSEIEIIDSTLIFKGLPKTILGARYHSLSATEETIPDDIIVTSKAGDGEIMSVRHSKYPVFGIQFHPESILTPLGESIFNNFLDGGCNND